MMTLELMTQLEHISLPPDVMAMLAPLSDDPADSAEDGQLSEQRLDTIAKALVASRKLAIDGRRADDIDKILLHCEEAYAGIDDANRGYFRGRWKKPTAGDGPIVTESSTDKKDKRSTAYVRMTARYVDIGSAKVSEILLPADDKAFSFSPTPVPEVVDGKEDVRQLQHDGIPLERDARPDELAQDHAAMTSTLGTPPQGAAPASPPGAAAPAPPPGGAAVPGKPLTVKDLAEESAARAAKCAKKAEKRVYDWLVESDYRSHMRKVLFDAARLGSGVIKGPYSIVRKAIKMIKRNEKGELDPKVIVQSKVVPGVKWVSTWNFFPDPCCGEDVQEGDFAWERDLITRKRLRDLKKQEHYLKGQIDRVIKEGPNRCLIDNPDLEASSLRLQQYEIWYFNGYMSRADFLTVNPDEKIDETVEDVHVLATLVNDSVIRAVQQPLDSGAITYYAMPWVRRTGCWLGVGVAEQLDMPQRLLNGAVRAMINNAGMTAGSQIAMHKGALYPSDGQWEMTPDKLWLVKENSTLDDIRKAIISLPLVNVTPQLITVIELAFRLAEESTSIPLVTQGQSGQTQPETLGGMQLQNNNANQLLRDIGYNCDDYITTRMIKSFYEWLLLHPDVPDDEKGDFNIYAHGSSALVERSIQSEMIASMAPMVKDPAFRIKPDRWAEMWMKSGRLDPRDLQYTDEEWDTLQKQPPPKPYQVLIAELRAQVDMYRAKHEQDRDTAYVQAEKQRTEIERQDNREDRELKVKLELLKYANARGIALQDAKTELAGIVIKVRAQREMAAQDRPGEALAPPNEPPGRAPTGQSFER